MLKAIKSTFVYITYYLCYFIPRKKKLWLYSSLNGRFIDNSKYLFLYANKHCKDVQHIWISSSDETVKRLRNKGFKAFNTSSATAKKLSLTAGAFIYSSYINTICNAAFTGGAFRFNLWHGIPLKKIEYDVYNGPLSYLYHPKNFSERWKRFCSSPELIRRNDAVLTTSHQLKKIFSSAFRLPEEKIFVGQYPRLMPFGWNAQQLKDHIEKTEDAMFSDVINNLKKFNEVIIYMPTWRDDTPNFIDEAIPDFKLLNKTCAEHNAVFILKLHINTIFTEDISGYSNLVLLNNDLDMYPLLPYTTALITDYSSIFFDYALLNKKIIFYPFDLENYKSKSRELYFDYGLITKDEIVANTFENLLKVLFNKDDMQKQNSSFKKYLNDEFDYDKEINFIRKNVGLKA
ncbi:MAG: CDP-glycerol glycerophosphotransferase family protein [Parafilimonas sp.]